MSLGAAARGTAESMLFKCKWFRQLASWLLLCLAGLITAGHSAAAADWTVSVEFDEEAVRTGEHMVFAVTVEKTSANPPGPIITLDWEPTTGIQTIAYTQYCSGLNFLVNIGDKCIFKIVAIVHNLPYGIYTATPSLVFDAGHNDTQVSVGGSIYILARVPAISSISASSGPSRGGDTITITGSDFIAGGTEVHFGGVAATNVSIASSSQLTATVPAHAHGAVDVVVSTAASKASSAPFAFTYIGHDANVALAATPSTIAIGKAVNLRATVTGDTPTGSIEFRDGAGRVVTTGALDSAGVAEVSVSDLTEGQHVLTAHYLGDANNYPATSSPVTISVAGPTAALETISALFEARANLLLANMPGAQRRLARLNGLAAAPFNPGRLLMNYLPHIAQGGAVAASASLAQMDALAGNEKQARFDAWMEGTFGLLANGGAEGQFGIVALGADYLVSDDVLIGGFFQIDSLSQHNGATLEEAGGTGWLIGPYLTARLSDGLYLDILAGAGRAENRVRPLGTYEDWFGSSRYIASATLQGEWGEGAWRFTPAVSGSWFGEISDGYVDSMGAAIPQLSAEQGQLTLGPGVRHVQDVGSGTTLTSSARMDAVLAARGTSIVPWQTGLHGRLSGGLDLDFDGGASLGLSVTHDGLFHPGMGSTSIRLSVGASLP